MGLVCDSRRWRSLTEMNSSCSSAGLFQVHSRAASAFSTWSRGVGGVRGVGLHGLASIRRSRVHAGSDNTGQGARRDASGGRVGGGSESFVVFWRGAPLSSA